MNQSVIPNESPGGQEGTGRDRKGQEGTWRRQDVLTDTLSELQLMIQTMDDT